MKKYFLFLLLFFCLISNVSADTIYCSPYSSFSSWSTTYIEEDDTTMVETERRYKWYKENKILGNYYIEGNNDSNYPLIDYNDFTETPYSEWSTTRPVNLPNRFINDRTIYEYQDMKEVRYIHLSNLEGSYGSLRISEIEVYVGGNKVSYSYYCDSCSQDFGLYIANGKTIENMSYVNNGGYIRIDLNNYYPLTSIDVKLYLFDVGPSTKKNTIKITRDFDFYSTSYAETTGLYWFSYKYLSEIVPISYNYSNMNITNPEWSEVKRSYNYIAPSPIRLVKTINEYQYKDRLYRYYYLEREYTNDYYKEGINDYLNKDDSMYQDYYRYQKRDKVVFRDELIITDYNTTLSDFIVSSTTTDIQIESNLNIKQNGIYDVKYILPFETITKKVEVNILDNKIIDDSVDELNNEIALLKEKNLELMKILELKEHQIKGLEENDRLDNQYIKEIKAMLKEYQDEVQLLSDLVDVQNNELKEINSEYDLLNKDYFDIKNKEITKRDELIKTQNSRLKEITNKYELLKEDYLNIKNIFEKSNYKKTIKSSIIDNNIIIVSLFIFLIFNLVFWVINKKRSN